MQKHASVIAFTGVITPTQITSDQNDYSPTGLAASYVLRLSGDSSFRSITGLQGGVQGREVVLINVGSNPIFLPSQHTGSSAANRFIFSRGQFLFDGEQITLIYDGTDSRWRMKCNSLLYPDPKRGAYSFTDLLNPPATSGTELISTISGGATAGGNAGASNRFSLLTGSTSSSATGRAAVMSNLNALQFSGGIWFFECAVSIPQLSTGTDRYQLMVGFFDQNTIVNMVDAAYFLYDEGGVTTGSTAAAYWQTGTSNNNTRTFNNSLTQVTVAINTWYKLRIEVNAAGTSVAFFINGTLVSTHTTNIPTASGREVGFGFHIFKSIGTNPRTVSVDYIELLGAFSTPR